jgi:hypothetical protein
VIFQGAQNVLDLKVFLRRVMVIVARRLSTLRIEQQGVNYD